MSFNNRSQCRRKIPAACKKHRNSFNANSPITQKQITFVSLVKLTKENIGLITFASSILTAIVTMFIKACVYAFERGKCTFWSVDSSHIDISSDNIFYNLLFYFAFAVCILFINYLFYSTISHEPRIFCKFAKAIFFIFIIAVLVAVFLFATILATSTASILRVLFDKELFGRICELSILISFALLIFGISFCISGLIVKKVSAKRSPPTNEHTNTPTPLTISKIIYFLIIVFISMAAFIVSLSYTGYTWTKNDINTAEYKIIDITFDEATASSEAKVVLYEGDDFFVVSPCKYYSSEESLNGDDLQIYSSYQTVIESQNVSFVRMHFDHVNKKDGPLPIKTD